MLGNLPVLALQGRLHGYEGHDAATTSFPDRLLCIHAGLTALFAEHRPDLVSRIVFITGDIANEETVATLRQTGAPCVEKPFRVQQFIDVIAKTMGRAE